MIDWEGIISELLSAVVISGIIVSVVMYLAKKMFDNAIDAHSIKQQAILQNELNNLSQNFGLYNNKKHELYQEVYSKLLFAEGEVYSLFGVISSPTYEEYDEKDIRVLLENYKIPNGKIETICKEFKEDREEAIKAMRRYLEVIKIGQVKTTLSEANNAILLASLYMSEDVRENSEKFLEELRAIFSTIQQNIRLYNSNNASQINNLNKDNLRKQRDVVQEVMVRELSKDKPPIN